MLLIPMRPVDELLVAGQPRREIKALWRNLKLFGAAGLISRAIQRDNYLTMQGITFTLDGHERPLPVDLIPRVITTEEWTLIESGVKQRITALEAFLADVYGRRRFLRPKSCRNLS